MAEETKYLKYGSDKRVSLSKLLEKLATNLNSYIENLPYTRKRKEALKKAYSEIYSKGINGAVIDPLTGQWSIDINGTFDNLDLYTDKFGFNPYYEASRYIQNTMSGLTEDLEEKKEDKKVELPKYDKFLDNFGNFISKTYFGNNDFRINEDWNVLDERDKNGLRGTLKRASRLALYLKAYSDSLEEGKYDFEGSAFNNVADLKSKINTAITALNDGTWNQTDKDALNAIGLRSSDWFNNGSGDPVTVTLADGTLLTTTYGQLAELKEALLKELQDKNTALLKALRANLFDKYASFNLLNGTPGSLKDFDTISLKLIELQSLNENDKSKISWAFKQGIKNRGLSNLSKEELSKFGRFSHIINNPTRLKKLPGLEGIYYDSVGNRLVLPLKGLQLTGASLSGILELNNPEVIAKKKADSDLKLREQYAKRTEMTPQDWEYVASIVPDIASIPDTEPISAAALAFTGAGMRHHALANRPGGMSTSDKLWLAADYLGAGFAAIPGFGDAYLVGRILNTTRKFATGLFAAAGAYGLASTTVNAFGKWAKGEDMTLQEKMDVVMAIPSLVSAYRLRSREGLNDAAKAANLNNITTNKGKVKVTITDESGNKSVKEITGLSKQKSKELLKQFKNAGNDNSKKTQILKNDSEVQTKASEQGIDLNKVSIETDSRHMASYRKPTEIEFYPEVSPSSARTRYNQEIENLKNSGHNWQARRLLIYDKFYRGTGGAKKESNGNWFKKAWHYVTDTPNLEFADRIKNGETPKTTETPKTENKSLTPEEIKLLKEKIKEFNKYTEGTAKHSGNNLSEEPFKAGNFNFNVNKEFPGSDAGTIDISFGDKTKLIKFKNLQDMMKQVAKFLKENRKLTDTSGTIIKKINAEEMGEILKKLKAKGVFKQGGTLDKQRIQQYKEFIKK